MERHQPNGGEQKRDARVLHKPMKAGALPLRRSKTDIEKIRKRISSLSVRYREMSCKPCIISRPAKGDRPLATCNCVTASISWNSCTSCRNTESSQIYLG